MSVTRADLHGDGLAVMVRPGTAAANAGHEGENVMHRLSLHRAVLGGLAVALAATPALAFDGWHIERAITIEGRTGAWDYVSLDPIQNRLYIGHRKDGLQVFDVDAGKMLQTVRGTAEASSNGAILIPEFDLGVSTNENGTIIPFVMKTLEAREPLKLGEELDTGHYDPFNKRLVMNMAPDKDGTDAIVLDVPTLSRVGVIRLPTKKMEGADSDGAGGFYVAARDTSTVYRLDTAKLALTATWPTPGCAQTNSLTIDRANKRIFLGCRGSDTVKPSFAVMNAEDGKIIFTAEIGGGNDGMAYDPELKRIFLANGVGAVLNVFEQVSANVYRPVEALGTRSGMRTLAMHPRTKKLYAVAADGSADMGKKVLTAVSPFYANTFFPNSFTVVTISK